MTSILTDLQEQYDYSMVAIEALLDDVMEPDKQKMEVKTSVDNGQLTISWTWRSYKNSKSFPIDEHLMANVKAYCFDLIIMTRNMW